MKKVVTIKEMHEMEKQTIINKKITPYHLMVNVGQAMYQTFKKTYNKESILVLCGTGNNGGDALVFGEQAFLDGKNVKAIIIGDKENQTEESLAITKIYHKKGIPLVYINDKKAFEKTATDEMKIDCIVDGIFGIGLNKDVTGLYKEVINWINSQNKMILSIDISSGLNADTGKIMGISVKANITYTVEAIKQGLLLEDAMDVVGDLKIIDVGMETIKNNKYYLDTFQSPPKRVHNTHKYHYKNVLTIGGQIGVMGAITLAGYSALVSGAGLSTVATNKINENHMIRPYPELMYEMIQSKEELIKLIEKKDAILFGLGMRNITPFEEMVFDYITDLDIPIVLDALGMLLLKQKKQIKNKRVLITPHYGEFAKLMDITVQEVKEKPLDYIKECINKYNCEIILKGASTIYATKEKIIFLNQGTPALAKAGSGDVLAGILLTYLARNLDIEQGILLHMLSAQEASQDKHEETILASDITQYISTVYRKYEK